MASRILVPLDGSLEAEQAFPIAAQLARYRAGTVILVHISQQERAADMGELGQLGKGISRRAVSRWREEHMDVYAHANSAAGYLAHAVAHAALANIRTETAVYTGPRLRMILAATRAAEADMIVISERAAPPADGALSGRLARQVSAAADVPVLVVRRDQTLRSVVGDARLRPLRAVVGLDGSPHAEAQLAVAARVVGALAEPGLGALHLVHVARCGDDVVDAEAYLSAVAHDLRRQMLDEHALLLTWSVVQAADPAAALVALADRTRRDAGVESSIDAIYGPGRSGEIAADAFDGADLLVIADHSASTLRWRESSGTLARMLAQTRQPVLVVREPRVREERTVRVMPASDALEYYPRPV
ncbi:MAG TPA: universal stress protein [Ktedonobacterales bacterium]